MRAQLPPRSQPSPDHVPTPRACSWTVTPPARILLSDPSPPLAHIVQESPARSSPFHSPWPLNTQGRGALRSAAGEGLRCDAAAVVRPRLGNCWCRTRFNVLVLRLLRARAGKAVGSATDNPTRVSHPAPPLDPPALPPPDNKLAAEETAVKSRRNSPRVLVGIPVGHTLGLGRLVPRHITVRNSAPANLPNRMQDSVLLSFLAH